MAGSLHVRWHVVDAVGAPYYGFLCSVVGEAKPGTEVIPVRRGLAAIVGIDKGEGPWRSAGLKNGLAGTRLAIGEATKKSKKLRRSNRSVRP